MHYAAMHSASALPPHHFELGSASVPRTLGQQRPATAPVTATPLISHCWHVPISNHRRSAPLCRSSIATESGVEPAIDEIPLADSDSFWLAPGQHATLDPMY